MHENSGAAVEPAAVTLRKIADAAGLDPDKKLDTVQLAGLVDCETDFLMSELVLDNELVVSEIAAAVPEYANNAQWNMFEGAINDAIPLDISPAWWREIKLRLAAELAEDDTLKGLIAAAVLYNRIKMGLFDPEGGVFDGPDVKHELIGDLKELVRETTEAIESEFS